MSPINAWLIFDFCFCLVLAQRNNVCRKFVDYATVATNPNCWYNPDVNSNTVDMVNRNGYPLEMYSLVTEDGYVSSLYRIPHSKKKNKCSKYSQPIFIQHGLQQTSEIWVDVGNRSLAFFLSDHCYDVWLGNFRGSPHSQNHQIYLTQDARFWNYSFHEIGLYDVKANLDFIMKKTGGKSKIIYIGHSMGTTVSYIYSIYRREEAEKNLAGLISLAPVAYLAGLKSPIFLKTAAMWKTLRDVLVLFDQYGLFKNHFLVQALVGTTCDAFNLKGSCLLIYYLIQGFHSEGIAPKDIPVAFSYFPSGGSTKEFIHYNQIVANGGNFRLYDYENENYRIYGSATPPDYDLANISIPVHLIYGSNDFLASKKDAQHLFKTLKTRKKSITDVGYNHFGFYYGTNVEEVLYPKLLDAIDDLRC